MGGKTKSCRGTLSSACSTATMRQPLLIEIGEVNKKNEHPLVLLFLRSHEQAKVACSFLSTCVLLQYEELQEVQMKQGDKTHLLLSSSS